MTLLDVRKALMSYFSVLVNILFVLIDIPEAIVNIRMALLDIRMALMSYFLVLVNTILALIDTPEAIVNIRTALLDIRMALMSYFLVLVFTMDIHKLQHIKRYSFYNLLIYVVFSGLFKNKSMQLSEERSGIKSYPIIDSRILTTKATRETGWPLLFLERN